MIKKFAIVWKKISNKKGVDDTDANAMEATAYQNNYLISLRLH